MNKIYELGVVIAAGGSSSRYGSENKLIAHLNGQPLFILSILNFLETVPAENIVVTVPSTLVDLFKDIISAYSQCDGVLIVVGGETRTQSVINGIAGLPESMKYVAIHDGARPLATCRLLFECYKIAKSHSAAIPGKMVTDTLKKISDDGTIVDTVDRSTLVAVETPQVFKLSTLQNAYRKATADGVEATDDAGIMEYAGYNPKIVLNPELNIKITFPEDIKIAEYYLSNIS